MKTPAQITDDELRQNTEGLVAILDGLHPDKATVITRALEACASHGITEILNALPTDDALTEAIEDAGASRSSESMDYVFEARDALDDLAEEVRTVVREARP